MFHIIGTGAIIASEIRKSRFVCIEIMVDYTVGCMHKYTKSIIAIVIITIVIIAIGNHINRTPHMSDTPSLPQLEYVIITPGDGAVAESGKTVTVNYTGTFTDGTEFDSSEKPGRTPFTFTLGAGQVIAGWDQGVAGMRVGETRKLTIPPHLAYGERGAPGAIPPNSTLLFSVTLLDVK